MISKNDIFKSVDTTIEEVKVPEWGGSIFIKTLSGTDRDLFEGACAKASENNNFKNIRAKLLVFSIVNEKGDKLFEEKDADKLGKKSSRVLDRLFTIAQKISGISKDDREEMEKN